MKKFALLCILFNLAFPLYQHAQIITTFAGNYGHTFGGDNGPATDASFDWPCKVKADRSGNILIADYWNARIRKVNIATGIITTKAGNGTFVRTGDGGPATTAGINCPHSLAADRYGNIFIATDSVTNAGTMSYTVQGAYVRKISPAGIITTIAGNGTLIYSGDGGPATAAGIASVSGMCVDTIGNLYLATMGYRIRKIDTSGNISTVGGNGTYGYSGDGSAATNAQIYCSDVAIDRSGNVIFTAGGRIRKIDTAGIITTIAGTGVTADTGDGGPATAAGFGNAYALAIDSAGALYVSDIFAKVVRMINPAGIITRIAGTGIYGYTGDGGPPDSAEISGIYGIDLDAIGNIYLADPANENIRMISPGNGVSAVPRVVAAPLGLDVRPLPGYGRFAVKLIAGPSEKATLIVSTISGTRVDESVCAPGTEKDLYINEPPGIYLLTAVTSCQKKTTRLVVR